MAYTVKPTPLAGVLVLEPQVFGDDRGFFFESFNARDFWQATSCELNFVQDNHSRSAKGVLRGLHYQEPRAQGKLVRVTQGEVFDVVVDIRTGSPTFCQWFGLHLSGHNKLQLWVPPGLAHGFLVLSEEAEFLYKTTDYWYTQDEKSLLWNDPALAIEWPLEGAPLLSQKDQQGKTLEEIQRDRAGA